MNIRFNRGAVDPQFIPCVDSPFDRELYQCRIDLLPGVRIDRFDILLEGRLGRDKSELVVGEST